MSKASSPERFAMFSDADEKIDENSRLAFKPRASICEIPKEKVKPSVFSHALSGTIGSLLAEVVLFPIDTVKLQVQTAPAGNKGGFLATAAAIILHQGAGGLYRGLGGALIKESIHSMNFWLWHGFLFRYVTHFDDTSATPPIQRLLLNLLAKQLNWLCTVPFEVISSVNQVTKGSPGFLRTAASLYEQHGIGAFYRGLPVSLLLAVNPAIMNTLITTLLRLITAVKLTFGADYHEARDHSAASVGIMTGISKAIATILTYPLIRAKVLQQTQISGPALGLREILIQAFSSEGLPGLYRGVIAMSFKTVLWNSLMMAFKHVLGPRRAITPPVTPPCSTPLGLERLPMMPLMAREPFPVELLTVDKLNEILSYLRHKDSSAGTAKRVEKMEGHLEYLSCEIHAMKDLLGEVIHHVRPNDELAPNGNATPKFGESKGRNRGFNERQRIQFSATP